MLKRLAMRANRVTRILLFRRRFFARAAFGVAPVASANVQTYCEWPTVLLRLILPRYLRPTQAVLDMGTGAHATLAIFAKKRCPKALITATELVPERAALARQTIANNAVDISCIEADLFDGITQRFDLILLTPPAIPTTDLVALGYRTQQLPGQEPRLCWSGDGGPDGLAVIRPFLTLLRDHLNDSGRALMAINPMHCRPRVIYEICRAQHLEIERMVQMLGIVRAYVIRKRSES